MNGEAGVNTQVRESSESAQLPGCHPLREPVTEMRGAPSSDPVRPGERSRTMVFPGETRREPGTGETYSKPATRAVATVAPVSDNATATTSARPVSGEPSLCAQPHG